VNNRWIWVHPPPNLPHVSRELDTVFRAARKVPTTRHARDPTCESPVAMCACPKRTPRARAGIVCGSELALHRLTRPWSAHSHHGCCSQPPWMLLTRHGCCSLPPWMLLTATMDVAHSHHGCCSQPPWMLLTATMDAAHCHHGCCSPPWMLLTATMDVAHSHHGCCSQPPWMLLTATMDVAHSHHGRCSQPPWMLLTATVDVAHSHHGCCSQPPWMLLTATINVAQTIERNAAVLDSSNVAAEGSVATAAAKCCTMINS
jgi:hypothetical protein